MRRTLAVLPLAALLLACDPARTAVIRLVPSPPPGGAGGMEAAVQAVERVSLRRGLRAQPGRCARTWGISHRHPRGSPVHLTVCAEPGERGLEVRVHEMITDRLTPKADSLRAELADSLRAFGRVTVR